LKIIYCGLFLLLVFVIEVAKSSEKSNSSVLISTNDVVENLAADLSTKGTMKDHFRVGMKFFMKDQYDAAIPDLIAATMIVDPYTWNYWYAEAYATLGVIYEFHSKDPNFKKMAYQYYSLALKRDPKTKSANYYIDGVKPKNEIVSGYPAEKNKKSISSDALN
jgi:hypothetical protein